MESSGPPDLSAPYGLKSVMAASSMFCRFWHGWSVHCARAGIGRKQKHKTEIAWTALLINLILPVERWTRIKLRWGQRRECPDVQSLSRVHTSVNCIFAQTAVAARLLGKVKGRRLGPLRRLSAWIGKASLWK